MSGRPTKRNSGEVFPEIQLHLPYPVVSGGLSRHIDKGKQVLEKMLPSEFFTLSQEEADKWLDKNLPCMTWVEPESTPDFLLIYFFCSSNREVNAEKVVPDIIRKWLIPEKEVHISGFQNMYFYMREINEQLYFLAEVKILVEEGRDLAVMQKHLPLLSNELALCLSSSKYLEQVLDTKGLSLDEKSAEVQAILRRVVRRFSAHFDMDLFRDMSTLFALSKPQFRKHRLPHHLSQIIVSLSWLQKKLEHALSVLPEKRHLEMRFIRSKLHFLFGSKDVLGLVLVVSIKDRYEMFESNHILAAVQKYIPDAQFVKDSYYYCKPNHDPIKYIYLEFEKQSGAKFTSQEIQLLKRELKEQLIKRIVKLVPSVFMIRNEEETMRSILLLSQELKYLSDLPQVMVHFEKQDRDLLYFTVLAVRVLKKHDQPLEKNFKNVKQDFTFRSDRIQNVGYLRKTNPKEANVFHLCIPKNESILRTDSSVNFYLARQKVISIITEGLGEVRDYNGGMILKQGELFDQFKHVFAGTAEKHQELLENFFFSLSPIEAQATLSIQSLQTLFALCLEGVDQPLPKRESVYFKTQKRKNLVFATLCSKDTSLAPFVTEELSKLPNYSKALVKAHVASHGSLLEGFIYECHDPAHRKLFQTHLEAGVRKWVSQIVSQQELNLGFSALPPSLDPRVSIEERSSTIFKMLFEGLTRLAPEGRTLALANAIDISPDEKTYTFTLRSTKWSDGAPLVAADFEYAWKKILSPSFYTPFAYFFYPIKNAKEAKEGKVEVEQVGVKAIDEKTLVVQLEKPSSAFLDFTAHSLYSPIPSHVDKRHPNWSQGGEEFYACNGPFKLDKEFPNGGYQLVKNPLYWDKKSVKLDRIKIHKHSLPTLHQMYKNDEIDWLGRPLSTWEPYFDVPDKKVFLKQSSDLHWCVFNVQRFPFDHPKMRQALSLAIDRKKIVEQLPIQSLPATSPLPFEHSQISDKRAETSQKKKAQRLFQEALTELGLTQDTFPLLTIVHPVGELRQKIPQIIAQQWNEVLGISCRLEEYDFQVLFSKMVKGDYRIGFISWTSWINDPLYTFDVFRHRNNRVNFSNWENLTFQKLLDQAQDLGTGDKRFAYFKEAEKILIEECPVIPVTHDLQEYTHKDRLKGAFCTQTCNVDFKRASIAPELP